MREFFKHRNIRPFALAVVLYALFAAIYFAPQISGEVLSQGDIRQYRGMTQEILETRERVGEDPQWSGSLFGGMPAYMINVEYPAQIIKGWVGGVTKIIDTPAAFILFAMLSMWLMLVMMGVGGYVAIVGGAMYGLSTYFFLIIGAGHLTKMWALVYAPLMMGSIYMTLRGNMLWGAALTALFTSLELGANHPQITYYFLLAAAIFWLSELYFAYRERLLPQFGKRTALLCVAGLLALLSNLSPLWYAAEHTSDTIRGGSEIAAERGESRSGGLDLEYATAWSYGIAESLNLLIPDFMGRDSAHTFATDGAVAGVLKPYGAEDIAQQLPTYWGTQPFTAGPTYLGAVVILLALIGFGLSSGRERWWIIIATLLMVLLSWGYNLMWFTELAFSALPLYNKFRVVSMTLVVVEWSVPLLASYGLWRLWRREHEAREMMRVVTISTAIVAGVTLVAVLFGGSLFSYGQSEALHMLLDAQFPDQLAYDVSRAMAQERGAMVLSDGVRTLIFVLLTALVIVGYLRGFILRSAVNRALMLSIVGALIVLDLGGVAQRFLSYDDFGAPRRNRIVTSEIDRAILADEGEAGYRVLNLTVSPFNDATTSYFHRSVGGYHGAKLSRYQDLIERYLSNVDSAVLDMLNTRYIIAPEGSGGVATGHGELITRPTALGAAWLVEGAVSSDSATEQLELLESLDLSKEAVIEGNKGIESRRFGGGEIGLVEYLPHHLTYKYKGDGESLAIFSEIFYDKGWRAYVDGVEQPYMRANYLLRAMVLSAGEHTVEWRFRAPRWGLIEGVTLIASLIILLSIVALIIYGLWDRTRN